MKIIQAKDYDDMSSKACELMLDKLNRLDAPVFGLATGDTPVGLYQRLVRKHKEEKVSFKKATTFNLDEYVGLSIDHPESYHFYMNEHLFDHIDLPSERAHVPNGVAQDLEEECRSYERKIKEVGNIDIQLLGIGNNGHIGFNEPGTPFDSRTAIFQLTESTRKSNSRFFESIDEVPKTAISMGLGTIMEAKEILLIVFGSHKADILARVLNSEATESIPATVLHRHDNVTIIADMDALAKV